MQHFVILFLLALFPFVSMAASFDCAKAATKIEKLVCADAELSKLDEDVNAAYRAALKDAKHAYFIKRSQTQWLQQRNACYAADCVKRSYERQISSLRLRIATTPAGKLITARERYDALLLPNGKVLIMGGCNGNNEPTGGAELYDPATNRFTVTGNLAIGRCDPQATLLSNGKVLVIGGTGEPMIPGGQVFTIDTGEIYDPVSGRFTTTHRFPLSTYAITPLPTGKILFTLADQAVLYDLATGTSSFAGRPAGTHLDSAGTLLQNGKILFIEEYAAELYDPGTDRFAATGGPLKGRIEFTATLLPNGKVLLVGGVVDTANGLPPSRAELYDPTAGRFTATGAPLTERRGHRAILLPNGKVLIAGGVAPNSTDFVDSLDLYDPATGTFSPAGRLPFSRLDNPILLQNGKVLFLSGETAELYDPVTGNP